MQTKGTDYSVTYSLVVKPTTVRVVLTLALSKVWKVGQLDLNNVFIDGDLEEDVHMYQSEGFVRKKFPTYVWKLKNEFIWP